MRRLGFEYHYGYFLSIQSKKGVDESSDSVNTWQTIV